MKKVLILDDRAEFPGKEILGTAGYSFEYAPDTSLVLEGTEAAEVGGVLCAFPFIRHNTVPHIREIKELLPDAPLIVYDVEDRGFYAVLILEAGADEVLSASISVKEAETRVKKSFSRYQNLTLPETEAPLQADCILIEDFKLYPDSYTLLKNGRTIELTPREFFTLLLLYQHRETILTREQIMNEIRKTFGRTSDNTRIADMFILNIRNKLGLDESAPFSIVTVRGRGYYLKFN
ncbi:winged helix-turn-helix transcriptional regulator [Indiicoccus explosivorum]|uniref:winged helix-turn-helix transcriptional regulator n=1 Tax=Indiicoccus explosivorum TaxID=1917864 RepID=UPI000B43EE03|nr:response regulator transcription factor [Indiicoccus explosivorum]